MGRSLPDHARGNAQAGGGAEGSPGAREVPRAEAQGLNGVAFAESLGPAPKKKARSSKKGLELATAELEKVFPGSRRVEKGFGPRHLVALYARLHEHLYRAPAAELLDGKSFFAAASAAERLVRAEFGGDMTRALDFVRWTWTRERERERWRSKNGGGGGSRIGWKLQFVRRDLLTDYRVEVARAAERGAGFSSHR